MTLERIPTVGLEGVVWKLKQFKGSNGAGGTSRPVSVRYHLSPVTWGTAPRWCSCTSKPALKTLELSGDPTVGVRVLGNTR